MTAKRATLLNQLLRALPDGYVVDPAWLHAHGLSSSSIRNYVQSGWLERVGPRLYRRSGRVEEPKMRWELALLSLQTLLQLPLHVGGLTALELAGYWHYAPAGPRRVWFYSDAPAARSIFKRLDLDAEIDLKSRKLFDAPELGVETRVIDLVTSALGPDISVENEPDAVRRQALRISSLERAILEVLDRVPGEVSFAHAEHLFEGLTTIRPRLMLPLLEACRSVKAKRLFLYFASRQRHGWSRKLRSANIDIGSGKRQIVPGGELDPDYLITVPRTKRNSARGRAAT